LAPLAMNLEGWILGHIRSVGPGWVLVETLAILSVLVSASGGLSVREFRGRDP
jgi:hypothetical protein